MLPKRFKSALVLLVLAATFPLTHAAAEDVKIAAAGDIACSPDSDDHFDGGAGTADNCREMATSDLILNNNVAAVLALGDLQYSTGRLAAFEESYDKSWGRFKAVTHPAIGNHDYKQSHGAGYYTYFGAAAGNRDKGYYSYDLGDWHLIALNSNCDEVGGCDKHSPQVKWLTKDLKTHPNACTLAYWHHPRFSSGQHGSNSAYQAFWDALYGANADLVLVGHDHDFERFAPQTPEGDADATHGIQEFVVGTGGESHYETKEVRPNSQKIIPDTFGALFLTLHADSYDWQFEDTAGHTLDEGQAVCH
ncbi:hypothetical protein BH24DEI2_BH24DEI2_01380 [soil metagenome]